MPTFRRHLPVGLLLVALLTGLNAPATATHSAAPSSVNVAGSLQDELGCPGDWQPDCAATQLSYDEADDVWQGAFDVPAGSWEYKAALNGGWTDNYGAGAAQNGPNIGLSVSDRTTVKFYYDHKSHWITDNQGSRIVTAPGSYQAQLGCPGDWDPSCLRSWLQDADGDGTYSFTTTALSAGSYEVKAAVNESWTENYGQGGAAGGANIPFAVVRDNEAITFRFVSSTNALTVSGGSGAAHDDDVWWGDLGHDSRDPAYRNPAGAVPTGTPVTLRLKAASGDLTAARVRLWDDRTNSQSILSMERVADDGQHEWWQATLPAASQPTIYWYRFVAIDGTARAFYEDDDARTGGRGQTFGESRDNSWQLTLYDPAFETPDWVKNAVIYQIFPDRFRDGDPSNNPTAGRFFYGETPTIVRSTGSDWNTPICDPRDTAGACPGVWSQNFYGGDLQGIAEKLDYLQALGVTALYLNPIFRSPSNHKYDTTDFTQIDPAFGDQALLETLASQASARGIRLILDGVFNHSSSDSIYFDRYGHYDSVGACESPASPYRDWYFFRSVTPGSGACVGDDGTPAAANYESWFGYESLPKLNSSNSAVRDYFYAGGVSSVGPYWLSWADGWRLDVAGDVDPGTTNDPGNDYWEGFRQAARNANSDAYIVGEEWGTATAWTLGGEWDATMNYQLSSALLSFWRDEPFVDNDHNSSSSAGVLAPLTPSQLSERVLNLQERYPPEAFQALMNLLGSHDTNRPLFMLDENADEPATSRSTYEDPSYDWSDAIGRLKGVALLQATLPGAPTIYYGDEIGLVAPPTKDGAGWQDDPYNRIPYPWLDESGTPFYTHLQSEAGQSQLRNYYSLLLNTRNAHPALRTGSLDILLTDDAGQALAYGRKLADHSDAAVIVVNRSNQSRSLSVDVAGYLPVGAQLTNVMTVGSAHLVDASGTIALDLPARGGALLVPDGPLAPPPAAVNDLALVATGATGIGLDWSAANGATSYDVHRSLLSGGGYELVANTASTDFSDSGLATGVRYHYVVVARDDATLLVSDYSNEVSATTGYDLGDGGSSWFNLQWPPSIEHTLSTTTRTENIYGQIWVSGATEPAGQAPGIRAQVGFGPDGSQPDSEWAWEEMSFNAQVGNNDEYVGTLLPDEAGRFDYAARWSGDGGRTWFLADLDGPERDGTLDNPGQLSVQPSGDDTTAPSAPVLSLSAVSASSVSLSWSESSDDVQLAGYEIFRDGARIARVGTDATTFSDENVTSGVTYTYYVKAFDSSFNRSAPSNEVAVTAENRIVQVTFKVGVPAFTPADGVVYVTGSIGELGPWNPSAFPLTRNPDGTWTRTFGIPDGTTFEWKYTRGNWDTVEQWDSIAGLANRGPATATYGTDGTMLVDNTATNWGDGPDGEKAVRNWRDPLVVSHTPGDDTTDVSVDTLIAIDWSKAMSGSTVFLVSGPAGPVAGTFALGNEDTTLTFTPAEPLAPSTEYAVVVSGQTAADGDAQQAPTRFTFTTETVLESISIAPHDPALRVGERQAFMASAHYSDGSSAILTDAVWSTSNNRVLSVTQSGVARARAPGTAALTAEWRGVVGRSTVTVVPRR